MIKLLRDAQAFVGKSRCSVGHSVSEVQDRAKTRSCIYCEQQFALYEALGRAIVVADEPSPPHEWETVDGKPLHCATCQCAELERAGFVAPREQRIAQLQREIQEHLKEDDRDPTPPHLMAQGYRSGHTPPETRPVCRICKTPMRGAQTIYGYGWQLDCECKNGTPESRRANPKDDGPCLICGKPWQSGHTPEERKACDDAL